MPETNDDSERFSVNRLDILMRTYKLSGTPEESSSLLISALAHHLTVQHPMGTEKEMDDACDAVKKELKKCLLEFNTDKTKL